jgi:hypothetical protein
MADTKIDIEIGVTGNAKAEAGLKAVNNELAKTGVAAGSSAKGITGNTQAMLEMGRIMQDAPYGIMGVANNITRLAETLMLPTGLTFAISAATSALVMFGRKPGEIAPELKRLQEDLGLLKKAFESLLDIENPIEKLFFPIKSTDLSSLLKRVKEQAKSVNDEINQIIGGTYLGLKPGAMSTEQQTKEQQRLIRLNEQQKATTVFNLLEEKKARESLISTLEEQIRKNKALETAYKSLSEAGLEPQLKKEEKEPKTAIDTKEVLIKPMEEYYSILLKTKYVRDQLFNVRPISALSQDIRKEVGLGVNPSDKIKATESELKENYSLQYAFAQNAANAVGNLFKNMWRDIFGEAQNFWSDFFGGLVNDLISLGTKGLAVDIINAIIPGAGLLGGLGLFGRVNQPTNGGTTQVINFNLGDKRLAQAVVTGQNIASQLRYT